MAKKQFIRHLEFYGFPDQNGYSSEISGVDLSDIREKNKEQDEEIQDLEGEKADKKDLLELSGTVENFITRQSEINQEFADAISGISSDIEELKDIDREFAEQLEAVTSGLDDTIEAVEILGERVDDVEDNIDVISGVVDTIIDEYVKKEDVYTKEEIDEKIPSGTSFATEEWVEAQGYLTVESGDSRYAKIEDIENIEDIISGVTSGISEEIDDIIDTIESMSADTNDKFNEVNDRIDELNEKLDSFSGDVVNELSDINDKIDEFSGTVADELSEIDNSIDNLEEEVGINSADIEDLKDIVSANTGDIEDIKQILNTKANVEDLENLHDELTCSINTLDDKKADKTDLSVVSGAVDDISARLEQEIERSTGVDERLTTEVSELNDTVQEAVETVSTFNERVTNVETGLTKEIADRKQADLDLIGESGDSRYDDTIWGAKNFAKEMKRQAVNDAEAYTNNAVAAFSTELADLESEINQKFTSYATTGYVEDRLSETKTVIESDYNTKINNEVSRATARENAIISEVAEFADEISGINSAITHNSTRINAITQWDGSDPSQYDNSGNGILDVLHREFHEFEKNYGTIKSIEVIDGNLIITYITKDGEKQTVVPISEILILDDYYTKEETDQRINEAIQSIILDDFYTKEEVDEKLDEKLDVSAFTSIDERVSANTASITDLFNRLGYTDNDTLVTSNPNEVAFGQYNVTHNEQEASGQTILSIGNGSSEAERSNAVEVRKDGTVYMWIEGEFISINNLLGMLAHEIY